MVKKKQLKKKLKKETVKRDWHLIDVAKESLGRAASRAAVFLIGKHKVDYTPHLDQGDFVVIINAARPKITGKKIVDKKYYRHSGYPGNLKEESMKDLLERKPARVVELAVSGMIDNNRLKPSRMKRLKIFLDDKHAYQDKIVKEK